MYLPEPKGVKAVLRLKWRDPLVYKLWCRSIRAEIRNLIEKGTFSFDDIPANIQVIPTTLINKVKLLSDGTWDKAKSRICVRGDIQRQSSDEDTWSVASSKRTVRMYLADAEKHNAIIKPHTYKLKFGHLQSFA